jgi:hypothetical protein
MPKIEIEVDEETVDVIKRIWSSNQAKMSEEVLRQLGWTRMATFAGDLLCLGFEIAAEDPRKFILHMRERKAPIFREPEAHEAKPERCADETMKAYA